MRKRLVYFSLSLAVALTALVTQFSPQRAVAKQPPPDEPSAECAACAESCTLVYQACTAETGGRGPGFGRCVREMQQCRHACDGRGGPCDKKADASPAPEPTPSPTPVPTPD